MANRALLRTLLVLLLSLGCLGFSSVALADPPQPLLRLPICGDQDGSELPFTLRCPHYAPAADVQMYQVPGAGPVTLRFDFVFREAVFNNELAVFRVDRADGSIGTLHPRDEGYLDAAFARAQVVFHSGADAFTADVDMTVQGGDVLAFLLVQAGSLAALTSANRSNSRSGRPVAFFSIDALNPDGVDHFVGFTNTLAASTQFGFEDLTGGGDLDYDDVVFNVSPALVPIGNAVFRYTAAGDSVAAGQDIDGASENKPFAYPRVTADEICRNPPSQVSSCAEIIVENLAVPGQKTSDFVVQQLPVLLAGQPEFITVTIGANDIMQDAIACITENTTRFEFILRLPLRDDARRRAIYLTALAAASSGCLTGLLLEIQTYLGSIEAGLSTIRSSLMGMTSANVVFTNYYNPVSPWASGPVGYVGRTFGDLLGAVNSLIALQTVQDPTRMALADVTGLFAGHEIGTPCSYIEPLAALPAGVPFGIHPNKLGQRVIASAVLRAARDKGFLAGTSMPAITCITQTAEPDVVMLHGADLAGGLSVSVSGTDAQVLEVSPEGAWARLRLPLLRTPRLISTFDVVVKNPDGGKDAMPAMRLLTDQ
jgi:hypothetical protein